MKYQYLHRIAITLAGAFLLNASTAQNLTFKPSSNKTYKEEAQNKSHTVKISIPDAKEDASISFETITEETSATVDKDYKITTTSPLSLTSNNQYAADFKFEILNDAFDEKNEQVVLKFKFSETKAGNTSSKEVTFIIFIEDMNAGTGGAPIYTDDEKEAIRKASFEVYGGSNVDFLNKIKLQAIGGELVANANSVFGKNRRAGFILGAYYFENGSVDSSNLRIRTERIPVDTGVYSPGVSRYIQNRYNDQQTVNSGQYGFYVNPTFRLNTTPSDLINFYCSARLEYVKGQSTVTYKTDTLQFNDTLTTNLGNSPVFQTSQGILAQKYSLKRNSAFLGVTFPVIFNAQNVMKFYVEPGFGLYSLYYQTLDFNETIGSIVRINEKCYTFGYLVRARLSEQYTGLGITIGGELRGNPIFSSPQWNMYVGLKIDIAKAFKS